MLSREQIRITISMFVSTAYPEKKKASHYFVILVEYPQLAGTERTRSAQE